MAKRATPDEDVEVRATTAGYVGGALRASGDRFMWPAGIPLGSWVAPVAFGGKGDHDGDGLTGGSKPSDEGKKLSDLTVPELRDLAEKRKVDLTGLTKKGDIVKALEGGNVTSQPTAEPFGDAPAPIRVDNEINNITGGTEPDWIAPPSDAPVQADD